MKGVCCALSWLLETTKFKDTVGDEAIVDALGYVWVSTAWSGRIGADRPHIDTSRGHLPLLIPLYRALVGLKERDEQVSDSRLFFNKKPIWSLWKEKPERMTKDRLTDRNAPLRVLSFKAGSLTVIAPDGIKRPAIYGSLFMPIELLDEMRIVDGRNANRVRLAGHFTWTQEDLDLHLSTAKHMVVFGNLSFEP